MPSETKIKNLKIIIATLSVLCIVLGVIASTLISKTRQSNATEPKAALSPLLDPELNNYPSKDMVTNIEPLRRELEAISNEDQNNTQISLYFEVLNTGANISVNKDMKIWPISLMKLPIAIAVLRKVENNLASLEDLVEIGTKDLDSNSGSTHQLGANSKVTIRELLKAMLRDSDNTAYNALNHVVTTQEIESVLGSVGLNEEILRNPAVGAKEYSRLLRSLYSSAYISQKNSSLILDHLSNNSFNEFLAQSIPKNVTFAHKWGANTGEKIYADAGIAYIPNRPYMITVLIKENNTLTPEESLSLSKNIFKKISSATYNYMSTFSQ